MVKRTSSESLANVGEDESRGQTIRTMWTPKQRQKHGKREVQRLRRDRVVRTANEAEEKYRARRRKMTDAEVLQRSVQSVAWLHTMNNC